MMRFVESVLFLQKKRAIQMDGSLLCTHTSHAGAFTAGWSLRMQSA